MKISEVHYFQLWQIYCTSLDPYVSLVGILYNSIQVVDTILYLYALPINYLFYSYLSLCLSCNLSQAQDCNRYRELVKGQKVEEPKLIKVNGVEEQKVKKVLNKRKVQGVIKYLVYWKGFMVENAM